MPRPDATQTLASVVYASTPEADWRCGLYSLFHHPANVKVLGLIGAFCGLIGATIGLDFWGDRAALVGLLVGCLVGVGSLAAFGLRTLQDGLRKRFAVGAAVRQCQTSLTPQGVLDEISDKTRMVRWADVRAIRESRGDVFVWSRPGGGCYVPAHAFASRQESRRFADMARTLWKQKAARRTQERGGSADEEEDAVGVSIEETTAPAFDYPQMKRRLSRLYWVMFGLLSVTVACEICHRVYGHPSTALALPFLCLGLQVCFVAQAVERRMIESMAATASMEDIGRLCSLFVPPLNDASMQRNSRVTAALTRLLPCLPADGAQRLTHRQAHRLYRRLAVGGSKDEEAFILAVLRSLERTLDTRALRYVSALAQSLPSSPENDTELQRAVRTCGLLLQEKRDREQRGEVLVRPAGEPADDQPLLRPAAGHEVPEEEQLLRAAEHPPRE